MIDQIGDFLQHNLVVMLAVVLVPMKWVVLRLCGDTEAQSVALLCVPEDLCYVTLGLILGDFATSTGSFRRHFHGSSHIFIDIFITAMINVVVAIIVHLFAKVCLDHFKSFRASDAARSRPTSIAGTEQYELPMYPNDNNFQTIQFRHIAYFSISYLIQIVISLGWLSWVAQIVSNG